MSRVDLHLHSNRSDGTLKPSELVRLCANNGLKVIALTDHDSTEGVAEAVAAAEETGGIEVIAGIELSCDTALGEVHVLGLFVDTAAADLQLFCERTRSGRRERGRIMTERLADAGININFDRVLELSDGGSIGRPHVARALVEAGYAKHIKDAFDRYLTIGGSGYVSRSKLTPRDAVGILVQNGALPVLAHPLVSAVKDGRKEVSRLEEAITELKMAGLIGLEVYYGDYTPDQVRRLEQLAQVMDLIPCGGSDFHNSGTPGEPTPGSMGPSMDTVEALKVMKRARANGVNTA